MATLAILALAATGPLLAQADKHSHWPCGRRGRFGEEAVACAFPGSWQRSNDELCRKLCKERDASLQYLPGNWALFEDTGLECCCPKRVISLPLFHPQSSYAKAKPYMSTERWMSYRQSHGQLPPDLYRRYVV